LPIPFGLGPPLFMLHIELEGLGLIGIGHIELEGLGLIGIAHMELLAEGLTSGITGLEVIEGEGKQFPERQKFPAACKPG